MIEPYITEKQCTCCGEFKLVTEFPRRRQNNGSPGYHSHCKSCRAAKCRERYANRRKPAKTHAEYGAMSRENLPAWGVPAVDNPEDHELFMSLRYPVAPANLTARI